MRNQTRSSANAQTRAVKCLFNVIQGQL